jgi:serine/threonine protein kinase
MPVNDLTLLERRPRESPDDWGNRLIADLADRHQRSARVPVEEYLRLVPGLEAESGVVLDLIAAEWTVLRKVREAFTLAEYVRRFPTLEQDLRALWEADRQTGPWTEESPQTQPSLDVLPEWYVGPAAFPVTFGAYRLVRELGSGGMARVYLADPLSGEPAVALKVPTIPSGKDGESTAQRYSRRERFLREAEAMRRLDHPRLCRVKDVGECDGLPFFTMQFYPGGSVAEELKTRGRFDPGMAARLVAEVARALQHVHDQGLVHRDLKPANLLRDEWGDVVVTDFGLVLALDEEEQERLTQEGELPGTVMYLSPEQAGGLRDLTPASDTFTLGVILYELLTGRPPFEGNAFEILRAIHLASPVPLEERCPQIAPELAAICRKAMAQNPAERYPSMTAFAEALERWLGGWQTLAEVPERDSSVGQAFQPASSPEADRNVCPTRRPTTPGRWIAAGVVGVLLAGLASGPAVWFFSRPTVVSTREPIGLRGQFEILRDDLTKLDKNVRAHMRYLSLMAVHDNPTLSDADFRLHREALEWVLKDLTGQERKGLIHEVHASGCLWRIDLRELDWDPGREWKALFQAEPYGVRYEAGNPDESLCQLARETYGLAGINPLFDALWVRADWFIEAATRPPLTELRHEDRGARKPFDREAADDPVACVVRVFQMTTVDARVAAAELGLRTVAEYEARQAKVGEQAEAVKWPQTRDWWEREEGFAAQVRGLKLGVPRARR